MLRAIKNLSFYSASKSSELRNVYAFLICVKDNHLRYDMILFLL